MFKSGGKVPIVPVVAVVIDCLIVFAFLSPFILPDKEKPVVSAQKPEPKVAGVQAPKTPKVLGESTVQPTPAASPVQTSSPVTNNTIAIAGQTNPIVAPELGLIPDPAPTTTTPPIAVVPVEEPPVVVTPPVVEPPVVVPPVTVPETPASFTTEITHAGQVTAGTQIGFNATKNEKTFYGGDLLLSTSSVTISRSGLLPRADVTVTSPDGAIVNMPSSGGSPALVMDVLTAISSGTTFPMFVDAGASVNGTYSLHITTLRTGVATDTWQYDGFLTVTIVD